MTITIIIIAITVLVSFSAFSNDELFNKLIFYPARMDNPSDYYRFITGGLIHADWIHLLFNMYVLYIFGRQVEGVYSVFLGKPMLYAVLYIFALVFSSLPSFAKHRHDYYYRALGASGAVAAVMFSYVYYSPWSVLYVWFIPMPSILFAIAYLVYSAYASRRGGDNVGHDAHFYGAIFGFLFTLIFEPTHGQIFIQQIIRPSFNL
ncbi:MAG: rhomboid family intramembrane serine protease [Chitinophagaceae bacterium]|nr:rhomboid family intramembrane serine protease [Chitinophagaceae bacterium]MCB9046856.1 rhomboid family intramembrane serine protease [Chitinophagales bacterium]